MSASAAFANDLLTALLVDGDYGPTYIALHTADTGADGTQDTNEVAYTGYARQLVNPADWAVSGATFENELAIEFPEVTGVTGSPVATHFTIGNAASGAGKVLLRGKLTNPLPITVGQEPRFKAGFLTGSVDTSAPV